MQPPHSQERLQSTKGIEILFTSSFMFTHRPHTLLKEGLQELGCFPAGGSSLVLELNLLFQFFSETDVGYESYISGRLSNLFGAFQGNAICPS